ncbi:MAG: cob(I)yrinic acid a,c-diamide adenosyltransferase [Parcubacteria group bacterium]
MTKKHLGKVHIYTGDGKGKTTAALGLALRAVGRGYKVIVVQFMKKQETGEMMALKKLGSNLEIHQFGHEEFISADSASEKDKALAREGLEFTNNVMTEKKPDVLILDEINVALHFKLLDVAEVKKFIDKWRDKGAEIILTGQKASSDLIEQADLVTEMKKVKHYFDKNIQAREGIEY